MRFAAPLTGIAVLFGFGVALQLAIQADVISEYVLPLPSDILASLPRLVTEEGVLGRFAITAGETLAAGTLALLVGLPLGWLLHRSLRLRAAFEPWVAALAAAPLILAYPLFLVLFGRSPATIVVIGFMSALPPVALKTIEGFGATRRVLLDVGRSLRLSPGQEFWKILFPAALPQIFVGLRLALVFGLINVVGVEFLINLGGLGQLINDLAERYDLPGTWGGILFVVLVSIAFFTVLDGCERWLRRRA